MAARLHPVDHLVLFSRLVPDGGDVTRSAVGVIGRCEYVVAVFGSVACDAVWDRLSAYVVFWVPSFVRLQFEQYC